MTLAAETRKVVTSQRFTQGFTYPDYIAQIPTNKERFQQSYDEFKLSENDKAFFVSQMKRHSLKVLALGEEWCPDVYRGLPVMARIAEAAGLEYRIFPRDKNPDIMNLYLNQGKHMSIPVFVFLDKDLGYLCHWIERPAAANKFMAELNAELAQKNLPQEERMREMRRRMNPLWESWRQETAKELRELVAATLKVK